MDIELLEIIQFYIHQIKTNDKLSIEERHRYQYFLSRYCEVVLTNMTDRSKLK